MHCSVHKNEFGLIFNLGVGVKRGGGEEGWG